MSKGKGKLLTKGVGGPDVDSGIRNSGTLELLSDGVAIGAMHDAADGFIRGNELIEHATDPDDPKVVLDSDVVLQAVEDAVEVGARLAMKAKGRPIQVVTANDALGSCRFYFIGAAGEVAKRLKALRE